MATGNAHFTFFFNENTKSHALLSLSLLILAIEM